MNSEEGPTAQTDTTMNHMNSTSTSYTKPSKEMDLDEPLLQETQNRFTFFPIQMPDVYEAYKKAVSVFWTAEEINFAQDTADIEKLNANEKHFINHILAFFAASDGIVMENLSQRFAKDVPKPEVRAFYAFQDAIESIHSEVYSLLIDTYVKDPVEKNTLFNAVRNFPAIKEKAEWALKWIDNEDAPFAQRLVAFAIVEGIMFSASFCAIFWMRERGLLPGLSFANQLIARDESLHADFATLLYSHLNNRLPSEVVHGMVKEAVDIETRFITESIPCSMIGMNSELMTEYIKYIADRLLAMLGYGRIFNKTNPFPFMEMSGIDTKSSFFERRVADYSRAASHNNVVPSELRIDTDADDF